MFARFSKIFADNNIRKTLSLISLLAAIGLAVAAMVVPPTGIIHSSVLWFSSQCFVFISGLLGVNMRIDYNRRSMSVSPRGESEKEKEENNTDK